MRGIVCVIALVGYIWLLAIGKIAWAAVVLGVMANIRIDWIMKDRGDFR